VRGEVLRLSAVTLSERGIMGRMPKPLAKGTAVEIRLMLPSEDVLTLSGEVIYLRGGREGAISPQTGVAIKFDRVTIKDTEKLHAMIKELLIGDIIANQAETIIKPD
jgi:hypothetical protein